jgi:enoyl-CoA hydratase/carnithine racemase
VNEDRPASTVKRMFENLIYNHNEGIASITINRVAVRNALNSATMRELRTAFEQVKNDAAVRVVILTGAGDKAFVAGADINELAKLTPVEGAEYSRAGQAIFDFIEDLRKPVIAAVNGYALGGGCELAMACTFRIASENAVFGQSEVKLGIIPGYGGTQRLARLIGRGYAAQALLTGEMISAQEALRIGLVNQVVPLQQLLEVAEAIARKITANAPLAVKFCLDALDRGMDVEASLFGLCCATEDIKEGTTAFLQKRAPNFKGK